MRWQRATHLLSLVAWRSARAQRPSSQSICDYYAAQRYGENNSTTQLLLVQSIVSLAYAGGAELSGAPAESDGIFNHGNFDGQDVYLRPWFDGSKPTTNLNDQPVGVDWLDGGGTEPLINFLTGSSSIVDLTRQTNQFRLFTHWFVAFGYTYGCSEVSKFPRTGGGGPVGVAYTHKYMDLNETHVGYFINQLTVASKYFGFSEEDAETLETFMNARYNVRCAPAVNGQLYSICFAEDCPLAAPNPDCDAYNDLKPNAANNGTTSTATPSASTAASNTPSDTASSTDPTTSVTDSSASNPTLSSGAIAGIAIGGAAVLLLAFGMWLYFRRRNVKPELVPVPVSAAGHASPASSHPYYSPGRDSSFAPSPFRDSYMRETDNSRMVWATNPQEIGDHSHVQSPYGRSPSPKGYEVSSYIAEMPGGNTDAYPENQISGRRGHST